MTLELRAFMVCVDYSDILAITLPYNRHHFSEINIITSVADAPNVRNLVWSLEPPDSLSLSYTIVSTDKFYENDAIFNKWAALEHGLDVCGRHGWICLMDADVLWPYDAQLAPFVHRGCLMSPLRRMFTDLSKPIPDEPNWCKYPIHRNVNEWAGYTQIFHGEDYVLGSAPWHEVDWNHAGGADSFFQRKWPAHRKIRPPWEVLHLGPAGVNWMGRVSELVDGSKLSEATEREQKMMRMWQARRQAPRSDPFSSEKLKLN